MGDSVRLGLVGPVFTHVFSQTFKPAVKGELRAWVEEGILQESKTHEKQLGQLKEKVMI